MPLRMLYPTVLVSAKESTGSGSILYSRQAEDDKKAGRFANYVLTNWHVIQENIEFKFSWRRLGLGKKTAKKNPDIHYVPLSVKVYDFGPELRTVNMKKRSYRADIVAWDQERDLALLKLKSERLFTEVAPLAARDYVPMMLEPVSLVGCANEAHPFRTTGEIAGIVEGKIFTQTPTYFSCSGGGLYRFSTERGRHELIGVVTEMGMDANVPVTHMAYSIPIKSVYQFLERNGFGFITKTP